ncbi:M23 family metallopeptidase [Pseudoxanthomonas mexicana]
MATDSERNQDAELRGLLKVVEQYALLGDNSVVRRIRNRIASLINRRAEQLGGQKISTLRPCGDGDGPRLSFEEVLEEFHADDRRRSIFLDPEEAVRAHYADFISGRLSSIEIRDPHGSLRGDQFTETIRWMRGRYPLVAVNHALARDLDEVVHQLRSLAVALENGTYTLSERNCTVRTESMGTRYTNNGRVLEEGYRVVKRCCSKDPCCNNETCGEQTIDGGWRVIWRDGDLGSPPPVMPEPYQPYPWDDREPFFPDGNNATVSSDWGWRQLGDPPRKDFHGGMDFAVPAGTLVDSIDAGRVVVVKRDGWANSGVVIESGGRTFTYWHIEPPASIAVGDSVVRGSSLGTVLSGGQEHLHYAHHEPPNGDPSKRSDANSRDPFPSGAP